MNTDVQFRWTESKQDTLLSMVEPIPSLWDKQNQCYMRSDINNRHLDTIGAYIGCSGDMVKSQFTLLKRRYARFKSKLKASATSGSAATNTRDFVFAEKMKFLDKTFVRRTTFDSGNMAAPPTTASTSSQLNTSDESEPFPSTLSIPTSRNMAAPPTLASTSSQLSTSDESEPFPATLSIPNRLSSCPSPSSSLSSRCSPTRNVQASALRKKMLQSGVSLFDNLIEQSSKLNLMISQASQPLPPPQQQQQQQQQQQHSLTMHQQNFCTFITGAMAELTEENQTRFMNRTLQLYLDLQNENK